MVTYIELLYPPIGVRIVMDMINEKLERLYSMNEVCQYLGITRDTCLTWIEKRGMPAVKIGRTWKFKISEIDEWMRSGNTDEK